MILQADGRIGFFFEEVPGGYCMVYIPYTIEELTEGKYSIDPSILVNIESIESTGNWKQSTDIYDLQGRRVLIPARGLYIVNGKKAIL